VVSGLLRDTERLLRREMKLLLEKVVPGQANYETHLAFESYNQLDEIYDDVFRALTKEWPKAGEDEVKLFELLTNLEGDLARVQDELKKISMREGLEEGRLTTNDFSVLAKNTDSAIKLLELAGIVECTYCGSTMLAGDGKAQVFIDPVSRSKEHFCDPECYATVMQSRYEKAGGA
jgi:hypothetical protein